MTSIKLTNIVTIMTTILVMSTISRAGDRPGKFDIFKFHSDYQEIEETPQTPPRGKPGRFDIFKFRSEDQEIEDTPQIPRDPQNKPDASSSTTIEKKNKGVKVEEKSETPVKVKLPPGNYGTFVDEPKPETKVDPAEKSKYQHYDDKFK